jgi:hypothetical protein
MPKNEIPIAEEAADSNYFATALAAMDYGNTLAQLSDGLAVLVKEVAALGRPGSLSLTIKLKPTGGRGQLEVVSEVTTKRPTSEPGKSLFFAGPSGELLREDPRQRKLDLGDDINAPRKVANL